MLIPQSIREIASLGPEKAQAVSVEQAKQLGIDMATMLLDLSDEALVAAVERFCSVVVHQRGVWVNPKQ